VLDGRLPRWWPLSGVHFVILDGEEIWLEQPETPAAHPGEPLTDDGEE